MKFRYSRHTDKIEAVCDFYMNIIGLQSLGDFQGHDGYQGIFLGLPNMDWHLEFTQSKERAIHNPDRNDLLVFYVNSIVELNAIVHTAEKENITPVKSKNPYWQKNGVELIDPDGFGVMLSVKKVELIAHDEATQLLLQKGINTWDQLLTYLQQLPYGRPEKRELNQVILENKGTCSSKHALAKLIADENYLQGYQLMIGIYFMDEVNTPGIGNHLKSSGLKFIPEAHCYLKRNGKIIDITRLDSSSVGQSLDIKEEVGIQPMQIYTHKEVFHKMYIKKWVTEFGIDMTLDEVWSIREKCIVSMMNQ